MYFDVKGKRVYASTGGKPFDNSRPCVIFLCGSGLDHTFWSLHSRFFAFRHYSVLCPDLPGHTNSEGPPLQSIEEIGEWLNDVVEALDVNNISTVAHSQGVLNTLEFVSNHPGRIRSVSLIASGLATPVNPALIDAAENDPEKAVAMMVGWGFGPAGHLHQGPIPGYSMVAGGRKVMLRNAPQELATDLKACDAYRNGKEAAAKISAPIQVMVAGKDRMAPKKATDELIKHLKNPEVHFFPESGHMLPQEAPDKCRDLLKYFIFTNNPAD
jgi:pimeloyl-ACP methyl ester carboxylesterase